MDWPSLKRAAFGSLRLKPDEFWSITLMELAEILEAVNDDETDRFEMDHRLLAWQTAHLMNVSGNMKKRVTMDSLVGKPEEKKNSDVNKLDRDEKNRKLQGLKNKFNPNKPAT